MTGPSTIMMGNPLGKLIYNISLRMLSIEVAGPVLPQPGAIDLYPPTKQGHFSVLIDHYRFARSAPRFDLRYAAYERFARNASTAPVLFYCGNEGALETFYNNTGALFEMAERLSAHVFFVEHRFYGQSLPFGNSSFTNEALQLLSIEQALADYAEVIAALPKLIGCTGTRANAAAGRCDVVLFGGSCEASGIRNQWARIHRIRTQAGSELVPKAMPTEPRCMLLIEPAGLWQRGSQLWRRDCRSRVSLPCAADGGMLAAWHRYKYPHLSVGAVASGGARSATPIEGLV